MKTNLSLLVIDSEYLVAMDAERILAEALNCPVTATTFNGCFEVLEGRKFDLAIIDATKPDELSILLEKIGTSAKGIVFTIDDTMHAGGVPGYLNTPVVLKPFVATTLVSTVLNALQSIFPIRQAEWADQAD